MERGTERERAAVRERWTALERTRAATRLLAGFALVGTGATLLLLAVADGVCFTTVSGGVVDCTSATRPPFGTVVALFGVAALACGLWNCRTALSEGG